MAFLDPASRPLGQFADRFTDARRRHYRALGIGIAANPPIMTRNQRMSRTSAMIGSAVLKDGGIGTYVFASQTMRPTRITMSRNPIIPIASPSRVVERPDGGRHRRVALARATKGQ